MESQGWHGGPGVNRSTMRDGERVEMISQWSNLRAFRSIFCKGSGVGGMKDGNH